MALPISPEYAPMEAELTSELPSGDGWIYEPKWDGFRCLAFRDGDEVDLRSKAGKPLTRYFPEVAENLGGVGARRFVVDGELVIPVGGQLQFDELLLRLHPAASRVKKLSAASPAHLIVFDLLADERGKDWTAEPLARRRSALEKFFSRYLERHPRVHLSPCTDDVELARRWLAGAMGGLDGVMAKDTGASYATGERTAMRKVKRLRGAECVVGGFRWAKSGSDVGSLLLGLYGSDGDLHHVGFCSAFNAKTRAEATERLTAIRGGAGFTGRAPSGQSRWRKEGTGQWEPVRPEVVVEVEYDHFSGGRFRHGTRFVRWRPDKPPETCRIEQVEKEGSNALGLL
jgi:ATP-dependent DNA ligase